MLTKAELGRLYQQRASGPGVTREGFVPLLAAAARAAFPGAPAPFAVRSLLEAIGLNDVR
eukprot:5207143-Prymnesium_polylepis.1